MAKVIVPMGGLLWDQCYQLDSGLMAKMVESWSWLMLDQLSLVALGQLAIEIESLTYQSSTIMIEIVVGSMLILMKDQFGEADACQNLK